MSMRGGAVHTIYRKATMFQGKYYKYESCCVSAKFVMNLRVAASSRPFQTDSRSRKECEVNEHIQDISVSLIHVQYFNQRIWRGEKECYLQKRRFTDAKIWCVQIESRARCCNCAGKQCLQRSHLSGQAVYEIFVTSGFAFCASIFPHVYALNLFRHVRLLEDALAYI